MYYLCWSPQSLTRRVHSRYLSPKCCISSVPSAKRSPQKRVEEGSGQRTLSVSPCCWSWYSATRMAESEIQGGRCSGLWCALVPLGASGSSGSWPRLGKGHLFNCFPTVQPRCLPSITITLIHRTKKSSGSLFVSLLFILLPFFFHLPIYPPSSLQFLYTFTMQQKRLALSLLAAMAGVATAESDVAQLTKDTFNDFVKENDLVLAECKFLSQFKKA